MTLTTAIKSIREYITASRTDYNHYNEMGGRDEHRRKFADGCGAVLPSLQK